MGIGYERICPPDDVLPPDWDDPDTFPINPAKFEVFKKWYLRQQTYVGNNDWAMFPTADTFNDPEGRRYITWGTSVQGAPNFFSGWNVTSSGSGASGQLTPGDGISVLLTFNDTEKLGDSKISHRMFAYLVDPVVEWVNRKTPLEVSFKIALTSDDPDNDYGFFEREEDEDATTIVTDSITFIHEDTQFQDGLTLQEALDGVTHEYNAPGRNEDFYFHKLINNSDFMEFIDTAEVIIHII